MVRQKVSTGQILHPRRSPLESVGYVVLVRKDYTLVGKNYTNGRLNAPVKRLNDQENRGEDKRQAEDDSCEDPEVAVAHGIVPSTGSNLPPPFVPIIHFSLQMRQRSPSVA